MGRVLLARDTVLGREVALKVLRDDLGLTPELKAQLVDRMRQEARAAAALSHPAMVTLHDMGEDEHVGLYLVFERIVGTTLRERLHEKGPLPPAEVAELARAHDRAVEASNTKLTDFGIARLPDSTLTRASTVLGTPAYSAPEALASGEFGAQSDQFSLAATLYEALTGKRAFPGDDAMVVATRVATGKQPSPTAVLPALRGFRHVDVIFDRALAKEAKSRFASCEAFGTALAAELEGANTAYMMTPIPRSSIVNRATRRWQNIAALGALVVIVSLVIVGRFREPEADGVSLKSVASAFAATAAIPHLPGATATGAASHHPRIVPSTSAAASAGSTSSASSATSSATTPSGSAHPALDSAPADAGRDTPPLDVRAADAAAPAGSTQR